MSKLARSVGIVAASLLIFALLWSGGRSVAEDPQERLEAASLEELVAELKRRGTSKFPKMITQSADPGVETPEWLREVAFEDLLQAARSRQKVVYGEESRILISEVSDEDVLRNARAVVVLVKAGKLKQKRNGQWKYQATTLAKAQDVCRDEPFSRLPSLGMCSGFLVAADVVVTAGHCVKSAASLPEIRFVFDFATDSNGKPPRELRADQVFEGKELVNRVAVLDGPDWAIVRLNRAVSGRTPAVLRIGGKIPDEAAVYVIGHPVGLPQIYAPDAAVRENDKDEFFKANLDSFGGNSGSMVVNGATHEVEGVLVRGEPDWVITERGCKRSLICPLDGCRGEDVTRIGEVQPHLALIRSEDEGPVRLAGGARKESSF